MDGILGVGVGVNGLCLTNAGSKSNDETEVHCSRDDGASKVSLNSSDDGLGDHQGCHVLVQHQVGCKRQDHVQNTSDGACACHVAMANSL